MFREQLKSLRKREKITQEQLAGAMGVERSTVGKWEGNDQIIPSTEMLNKLAEYFNVSIDYLLGRKINSVNDDDELNEYLEELRTRPELRMLFQLSRGASKEDVEKAVTIIETLLK